MVYINAEYIYYERISNSGCFISSRTNAGCVFLLWVCVSSKDHYQTVFTDVAYESAYGPRPLEGVEQKRIFASTMDGGQRAITIDEVPLEWCFQAGVKFDFRHFENGYVITADDVEAELTRIGHDLSPLEIVVVNTAAGAAFGGDSYVDSGCGMGLDATMYLLERGVRLTGTDAWSWDAPFSFTAERYQESKNAEIIWEGHRAGRNIGYCHLEKLHNLESLPDTGFTVACFPMKIRGASAGWTRAVAIIDD